MNRRPSTSNLEEASPEVAELSDHEVQDLIKIMEATRACLSVVDEYCERYPVRHDEVAQCWTRIVKRVPYEDCEGKETMRRPRKSGKRQPAPQIDSMPLAMAVATIDKVVQERIHAAGWDEVLDHEGKIGVSLAWRRVKLRCEYKDRESIKRVQESKKP